MGVLQDCFAPTPGSAWIAAELLGVIHDKTGLDLIVRNDDGVMPGSILSPPGLYPGWYWASCRGAEVLVLNCCESASHGISLWDGYTNILTTAINRAHNDWLESWTAAVETRIAASNLPRRPRLNIFGYSAGGAAAWVYASERKKEQVDRVFNIITFGSPKPFNRESARLFRHDDGRRYMMDGDPVTDIPPPVAALHIFGPAMSIAQLLKVNSFVHPGGGVILFPDGRQEEGYLNRMAPQTYALSFGTWLFNQITATGNPHNFANYVEAVRPWEPGMPTSVLEHVGGGGEDWPEEPKANIMQQIIAQSVQTLHQAQDARPSGTPVIPPITQMKAVHRGKVWVVEWQGAQIAVGPSKRSARALARRGNAFLRELLPQGVVDPDQVSEAFAGFVAQASDETSGVHPTMQTVWPAR